MLVVILPGLVFKWVKIAFVFPTPSFEILVAPLLPLPRWTGSKTFLFPVDLMGALYWKRKDLVLDTTTKNTQLNNYY